MTDNAAGKTIEALEHLMNEEVGCRQAKHVVLFRVFVGETCVGGSAPFFLDMDAANIYYNDLLRRIAQEALAIDRKATRATVTLHDKNHEWGRPVLADM